MRILFMHHFPLRHSEAGPWVRRWALALAAAGHESRCLVVDSDEKESDVLDAVRVTGRRSALRDAMFQRVVANG